MSAPDVDSFVIGPDDTLVLLPRTRLTPEQARDLAEHIPTHLRGRIVVVDGMDAKVMRSTPGSTPTDLATSAPDHAADVAGTTPGSAT